MIVNAMSLIAVSIGLLAGILITWLYFHRRYQNHFKNLGDLEVKLAVETERNQGKDKQINELTQRLEQQDAIINEHQQNVAQSRIKIAELQTLLEEERRLTEEKLNILEKAEENMKTAFENLSNRIIEEKSKKFTEQNKLNIGEVLTPLREQLGDFRKKIEDVYDKESKDRLSLFHEITSLKSLNEQMSKDAINLTRALKGDSKLRGNWGEMILERVLENSGLKKGREYEVQTKYQDKSGKTYFPDVVIHMPNKKDVVIDSKVSLNAYERYYSAEEDPPRQQALSEHLASMRNHINELKKKNYADLVNMNSLDMILMFVPIEPALMLALENDENLFQDAFKNGIFLVSPSTLSMNLRIIQNMWRNEAQNRNAMEIARRAGAMYDKFVGFIESMEDIGEKLDKAQISYQQAFKRLRDGRGNLISSAESIRELGLETRKSLPDNLVDNEDNVTTVNSDSNTGQKTIN